jgi:hypothetical protein
MGCEESKLPKETPSLKHIYNESVIEYQVPSMDFPVTLVKSELELGEHFLFKYLIHNKKKMDAYQIDSQQFQNYLFELKIEQLTSRDESIEIFIAKDPKCFLKCGTQFGFPFEYRWSAYKSIFRIKSRNPFGRAIKKMYSDFCDQPKDKILSKFTIDETTIQEIFKSHVFFKTMVND